MKKNLLEAQEQALSKVESIVELVDQLQEIFKGDGDSLAYLDITREELLNMPLEAKLEEGGRYMILLTTGGPAVRLTGIVRSYPLESVRLECADWGEGWTEVKIPTEDIEKLLFFVKYLFEEDVM